MILTGKNRLSRNFFPVLNIRSLNTRDTTDDGNNFLKSNNWDFPGGAVVKNPPANARDTGSSPGPGRSHTPRSS